MTLASVIQWLLVIQLTIPKLWVVSRSTYPSNLDLDVILGISPRTTTIDYDMADFDEQVYGPTYGSETVKSGAPRNSETKNPDKVTAGTETSNKHNGKNKFMMMRQPDSNDNVDGSFISDPASDNIQMSSEDTIVLGGASGGLSGQVADPDPDVDADGAPTDGRGKSSRQVSSSEVTNTPRKSQNAGKQSSRQIYSNEVTGKPRRSKGGQGKSSSQVSSTEITGKPSRPKDDRDKSSRQASSNENTDTSGKTKSKPSASSTEKSKSSKQKGASSSAVNGPSQVSTPYNHTFSSCFKNGAASSTTNTDFCRFANAVYNVCKTQFSSDCSSTMSIESYGSESSASDESIDAIWRSVSSLESADYASLSESLESFESSESSNNEMKEVLDIVKALCPNVCSAARTNGSPELGSQSADDSAESSTTSTLNRNDDESSDNESSEFGTDPFTMDDDYETENEDSDERRRNAKADGRRSKADSRMRDSKGSGSRNRDRKSKTSGRDRNKNYPARNFENDNETDESDYD